ncbi:hypothetical protein [Lysinibacillus sp. TE18511]
MALGQQMFFVRKRSVNVAAATRFFLCESEAAATRFFLCESEATATCFFCAKAKRQQHQHDVSRCVD